MIGRARDADANPLVQDLIVPDSLVVGMEQHVRVAFHHPRHQRRPRHVDDCRVRRSHVCREAHGVNAFATDTHRPTFVHRLAVEHTRGTEHGDGEGGVSRRGAATALTAGWTRGLGRQGERQHEQREEHERSHVAPYDGNLRTVVTT